MLIRLIIINNKKMKKQIKKFGGSLVITFSKDEIEWYKIKEGDWIDIGNIIKLYKKEIKGGIK